MSFISGFVSKPLLTFKLDFKMSTNKRSYFITTEHAAITLSQKLGLHTILAISILQVTEI